jgi:tetratricopeptide (TPR) repeat protein
MRCEEAEEARLARAAGPIDEAALAAHLAECERCRAFAGEIDEVERRLSDALAAAAELPRAASRFREPRRGARPLAIAAAVATAALVLAVAVPRFRATPPPVAPPAPAIAAAPPLAPSADEARRADLLLRAAALLRELEDRPAQAPRDRDAEQGLMLALSDRALPLEKAEYFIENAQVRLAAARAEEAVERKRLEEEALAAYRKAAEQAGAGGGVINPLAEEAPPSPEKAAALERKVAELRAHEADLERAQAVGAKNKGSVVLLRVEACVEPEGSAPRVTLDRREASGVAIGADRVATAKRAIEPWKFDVRLAALAKAYEERGFPVRARVEVFAGGARIFAGEAPLVAESPDVWETEEHVVAAPGNEAPMAVRVRLHDPAAEGLAVLAIPGAALAPAATGPLAQARPGDIVVALAAHDPGQIAASTNVTNLAAVGATALELGCPLPGLAIGAPVFALDGTCVAIVTRTDGERARAAPIGDALAPPSEAASHKELARAHLAAKRFDDALREIEAASQVDPNDPWLFAAYGEVLAVRGDAERAAASYLRAGAAYRERGAREEALACARKAAALRPQSAEARAALGESLFDAGRLDQARAAFEAALELDPEDLRARFEMGRVSAAEGDLAAAAAAYRRVIAANPGNFHAIEALADLYREGAAAPVVSKAEASELLRRALELDPRPDMQRLLREHAAR